MLSPIITYRPPLSCSSDIPSGLVLVSANMGTICTPTITPSGGVAPYTYFWDIIEEVSNSTGELSIPVATTASTDIKYIGLFSVGNYVQGTVRCTVTDLVGTTASVVLSVSATRVS